MSATYNWAYKPSVINKYGFTVPAGADTARPTGWCYVALFGNDSTGNGSRQYPYRTITKAYATLVSSNGFIVLGSGVWRESVTSSVNPMNIIGDGDVRIDITFTGYFCQSNAPSLYNIYMLGAGASKIVTSQSYYGGALVDSVLDGLSLSDNNGIYTSTFTYSNCIIKNSTGAFLSGGLANGSILFINCTFYNMSNLAIGTSVSGLSFKHCIFVLCNMGSNKAVYQSIIYSLFFQCNYNFTNSTSGGVLYPSVPSGYAYYSTIATLQAAGITAYGSGICFGCTVADPLFNNLAIGDMSLSFSSPAKNLSYFGTYVGAKSIAYQVKASVTESTGSFDFSTNVNLTIANDSITLTNPTVNAEIKTKLIINANGRQILKFPLYGFNADRNGQYVDSIPDLDTVYKNPGDTLSVPTPYLVEGFAITYNGNVYQIGDRFTTVTGVTTFSSGGAGTLREILEAPERHTIMARFSDGGATVSAGDALVSGYWYYVISGSVTYDSVVYNAGQGFKAVDTNAFTGSGSVQVALSTESFQHYEPGIQPTSNNTGDTRTGSIIRGNGDPAYVRGGYGVQEFPINAKFIQLYYLINVANLKP